MTRSAAGRLHEETWLLPENLPQARPLYARDAVVECHLPGHAGGGRGGGAAISLLRERAPSGGAISMFVGADVPRGMQIRIEMTWPAGHRPRRARERHLIQLTRGRISRHIVYPEKVPADPGDAGTGAEALHAAGIGGAVVARESLPPGFSGAPLERLRTTQGQVAVVKHIAPRWSWVMRATGDDGREARLWDGDSLRPPVGIDPAIIGVARTTDRWLLYMKDVTQARFSPTGPFPVAGERAMLRHLASLYRVTDSPPRAACPLERRLALFSKRAAEREAGGSDLGPKMIDRGWDLCAELLPGDLHEVAQRLADEPSPLAAALQERPCVLVHGDLRPDNLATAPSGLVVLDWALASWAPPVLDMMWFLFNRTGGLAEEELRALLEDICGTVDDVAWDLALVATFVQVCPYYGTAAVQDPSETRRAQAQAAFDRWVEAVGPALSRHSASLGL